MVKKTSAVASKPIETNEVIEDVEIIEESAEVPVKEEKSSEEDIKMDASKAEPESSEDINVDDKPAPPPKEDGEK